MASRRRKYHKVIVVLAKRYGPGDGGRWLCVVMDARKIDTQKERTQISSEDEMGT